MITAVLDACVLYPPSLRDLLMWLAFYELFEPRWTNEIHDEWIRNVLTNDLKADPAKLARTRMLMDEVQPDSLVSGYGYITGQLTLDDPADRHVLAAAIFAEAEFIVTYNFRHFKSSDTSSHNIRAIHPDNFLCAQMDQSKDNFIMTVGRHRTSLHTPPKTPPEYISTLRANRLLELANRLEEFADTI